MRLTLAKLVSSSNPQPDVHVHRKIVHSSLNPSDICPIIANHCLQLWNNDHVNNPNGSTYKQFFSQITQDYQLRKHTRLAFSTQDRPLQVKQSPLYPWTPSHCNVRTLSRTGNSQSLSHQLPCVPTPAFKTPPGNNHVRHPV